MALRNPLQFQTIEIPFGSLDQKTADLVRNPGSLERAVNVEYDKQGRLNKRRGYQFVPLDNAVGLFDDDSVFIHLGKLRNELLVISYDHVLSLVSKDELVSATTGTATLAYRGPNNRGNGRLHYVSTARTTAGAFPQS